MEDGREVITLEDISNYFLKSEKVGFIAWPVACGFMYLFFLFSKWIEDWLIWDILSIGSGLLCIYSLVMTAINIKKIKNGTYFTVTTDVLRRKEDSIMDRWTNSVMRLHFQYDRFDILTKYCDTYHKLYRMQLFTVYDTAFEGDSFSLVKVKKQVLLVFNNKLFDVQIQ